MSELYTAGHIDYLQRGCDPPRADWPEAATIPLAAHAPAASRHLFRVRGVGRTGKADARAAGRGRFGTEELVIGLHGLRLPLVWRVVGDPGGVGIDVGTWHDGGGVADGSPPLHAQRPVLESLLRSVFPAVSLEPLVRADAAPDMPAEAAFALGIPGATPLDPGEGLAPWDRIIRGLAGATWQVLVVATPVPLADSIAMRDALLDELRAVRVQSKSGGLPSPVADEYGKVLESAMQDAQAAVTEGGWRTGVYGLGSGPDFARVAAVFQGVFAGTKGGLAALPVRVRTDPAARAWAARWALPDLAPGRGPGRYQHPYGLQTLVPSSKLAAYAHLPRRETAGFSIVDVPTFDVMPAVRAETAAEPAATLDLGAVVENGVPRALRYRLAVDDLTRHAFVAGVTGAGKTNTIFHMLQDADARGVPFLVLEPAKTEYRALLGRPGWTRPVQVFTLGNELAAPLRLNPFEVPAGAPVAVHIDLLRSVFNASFGLWDPLPQVLEQSLHRVYEDRGWDVAQNRNLRHPDPPGGPLPPEAFPTLADLALKVEELVPTLGYGKEVEGNVRTALLTRINGLRAGGKGRLLDVRRSIPLAALLERSTVLELEGLGDDDDRAFVMGLFFVRLVEHWRTVGATEGLRHILVLEEAHRLLAASGGGRQQQANADPRAKAVEAFANMLAEIRAYGQGIVVADQIPTKLASEVVKNTNLKIVHRLVDAEDRERMGGAMAMDAAQTRALAALPRGQAAVFAEGDDAPLLVQVPLTKGGPAGAAWPTDARVREAFAGSDVLRSHAAAYQRHPGCTDGATDGRVCAAMRAAIDDPAVRREFARLVLSSGVHARALPGRMRTFWELLRPRVPTVPDVSPLVALRCAAYHASTWYAARRGAQDGWPFPVVAATTAIMERALHVDDAGQLTPEAIEALRTTLAARAAEGRGCAACTLVHAGSPAERGGCPFAFAVRDEILWNAALRTAWAAAYASDRPRGTARPGCRSVALAAAGSLLDFSDPQPPAWTLEEQRVSYDAFRRAALCFAHRMLTGDTSYAVGPALDELDVLAHALARPPGPKPSAPAL